jgi:hypothetical protein
VLGLQAEELGPATGSTALDLAPEAREKIAHGAADHLLRLR